MTTEAPEATPTTPEGSGAPEAPAVPQATPQNTVAAIPAPSPVEEPKEPKVLDLTAMAPNRRLVKLPTDEHPDGENFELRLLDDFGIAMQQKLLNWSRTYERLFNKEEDLTEDEEARLKFVLDNLFEIVLDAPKAVKAKMSDGVRSRVMTAFSLAPLIAQQERAEAEEEKKEAEDKEKAKADGEKEPQTSTSGS